jgi:hypothetical protein
MLVLLDTHEHGYDNSQKRFEIWLFTLLMWCGTHLIPECHEMVPYSTAEVREESN